MVVVVCFLWAFESGGREEREYSYYSICGGGVLVLGSCDGLVVVGAAVLGGCVIQLRKVNLGAVVALGA